MKIFFFILIALCCSATAYAQMGPGQMLPLRDLSAFQSQAGNWLIVGDVLIDPTLDIHDKPVPVTTVISEPEPEKKKKRKKRKKRRRKSEKEITIVIPPQPEAVTYQPGTGILLNMNDDTRKDNLLTKWEHGDLVLELEVMIPKGSNSGIYLQGRYEVQLLDSWGKEDPSFSDIGGIYRNWEREKGKIYMGKAPITNAAKAPGLWQQLKIGFKAPRFDHKGEKVANAKFVFVDLNGIRIHENLEVPLPTGGPLDKQEAPRGPLMIQGDHGPVAFRNIRYQLLEEKELTLAGITYEVYEGPILHPDSVQGKNPVASGTLNRLSAQLGEMPESFAIVLRGNVSVAEKGEYPIRLNYAGGTRLQIGEKEVTGDYRRNGSKTMTAYLEAGENSFELVYHKIEPWWPTRLGFFNTSSFPVPLHAISSFPPNPDRAAPIYVDSGSKPKLLRAFLDFEGDRNQRLTHVIGVGTPQNVHYVYDLKAGNVVCVWRGAFLDATPMWFNRGDGSFRPRGAVQYLFPGLSIAFLEDQMQAFPVAMNEVEGFVNKGYEIDAKSDLPKFRYGLDSLSITDMLVPALDGNAWNRVITIENADVPEHLYYKLGEGKKIEQLPNGMFVIDRCYYIDVAGGVNPQIRTLENKQELMVEVKENTINYTINW